MAGSVARQTAFVAMPPLGIVVTRQTAFVALMPQVVGGAGYSGIYQGSDKIAEIYLGTTKIGRVYAGAQLVYRSS